jgi:hypothetical protein
LDQFIYELNDQKVSYLHAMTFFIQFIYKPNKLKYFEDGY